MQSYNLRLVDESDLSAGMTIYYRYDETKLSGPFKVLKTYRDHEGSKALLRDGDNDRSILLADDEDYGTLYIYAPSSP